MKSSTVLKTLKNDLKQFGLNPNHWTIMPLEKNKIKVVHNSDSDLSFIGRYFQFANSHSFKITDLQVVV